MIFLGKVLGVYAVGLVQAVVVFGFGAFFAPLGDPVGLVLTTLLFILVGCAMALTISSLARNEEQVQDIGAPIALLMAALGGGMFPLENAPYWMRCAAMLFPTGWAMDAYNKLMREGKDWRALWLDLLVLAAFAAVFFVIGGRSLRR
jgi:ABC-2 type transport system permease protein